MSVFNNEYNMMIMTPQYLFKHIYCISLEMFRCKSQYHKVPTFAFFVTTVFCCFVSCTPLHSWLVICYGNWFHFVSLFISCLTFLQPHLPRHISSRLRTFALENLSESPAGITSRNVEVNVEMTCRVTQFRPELYEMLVKRLPCHWSPTGCKISWDGAPRCFPAWKRRLAHCRHQSRVGKCGAVFIYIPNHFSPHNRLRRGRASDFRDRTRASSRTTRGILEEDATSSSWDGRAADARILA